MQLTLKCKYESGSVGFPAERIDGLLIPERTYAIEGAQVTLSGHEDAVLHHDADELLAVPGGVYRLPTPAEQEQATKAKQQFRSIQEVGQSEQTSADNTGPSGDVQDNPGQSSAPDVAEQNTAPLDSPPAQQKPKKE